MPTASSSTTLAALAIGSEVPTGDFEFRVHSVFGSALNLSVADGRVLVTLVNADADDYPQGIRLGGHERFDSWPVTAGTRGRRRGDALWFDACDAPGIDLAGVVVASRTAPPRIDPRREATLSAWAACAFHLDGLQEEKATDLRLAAICGTARPQTACGVRLAAAARELADCVRARDAGAAGDAAGRMLGLGTGLTPAGDDCLCGLLAALWSASADRGAERRFVADWGRALSRRLGATNAISSTFLECAIAGCFPGAVTALAAAFAGSPAGCAHPDARPALDRLCAMGHSSGMDTATGFLFGLWLVRLTTK